MRDGAFPLSLSDQRHAFAAHHIGQHGIAVHIRRAADQLNTHNRRCRNPAQQIVDFNFLAGGKLAVDQDIATVPEKPRTAESPSLS
jgi:hypothetical protein